jgi:hypothetical protein
MKREGITAQQVHSIIHVIALCSIAIGLVFGKAILSISLLAGLLNLIILADFKSYWKAITSNRLLHLVGAYYLFHFVSLIWSTDIDFGLHDTKVRSSLVLLLLLFVVKAPQQKDRLLISWVFVLSLLLATAYNFGSYTGYIGNGVYDDVRGMSHFGSHIRFALLVVTGILVSIYLIQENRKTQFVLIPLLLWLVFYTYYSQVVAGYITLFGVGTLLLVHWAWKSHKYLAIGILSALIISVGVLLFALFKPLSIDFSKYKDLPQFTKEGNAYYHKPVNILPETGEAIEIMICWTELEREWNKLSEIPFRDGKDIRGQLIQTTIIRYLASKELSKDAEGISQLSQKDVKNIENGNASIYSKGFIARWYGLQYQLNNANDPNGHSLLERKEYWKHGVSIARKNLLIGTGIGDVQLAFDQSYSEKKSRLLPERQDRAHNMILTTLISMGVIGLFLFIWFHTHFISKMMAENNILAIGFSVVLILSYLTEDTLETQTGVSFAGFFLGYFYMLKRTRE